jgi:transcriptional regulator with XRE-family HTH domain
MTTLTQAQFARHLGVDRAHITRLKHAGRLVLTPAGQIDVEASEARIAATADPAKAPVAERHAAGRAAAVDGQKQQKTAPEDEGDPIAGTPDYQKSRARREEANANLAEIELAKCAWGLLETSAANAVLTDANTMIRAALESMGAILSPQFAVMNDEHAIRQLFDEHASSVLNELCDELENQARS